MKLYILLLYLALYLKYCIVGSHYLMLLNPAGYMGC
jgi:hypothetical protein